MNTERTSRTSAKKKLQNSNIYVKSILKKKISIPIQYIGSNVHSLIEDYLKQNFENKCIEEGFIKDKTISLLSHTPGVCQADKVIFDTVFECLICNVSEGTSVLCVVKNISKAGLRCELNENHSPLVIFVARDHHLNNELYEKIEQENQIKVNIIGSMFELNDTFISAIGTLEEIKTK
tara:strand:- start:738 stop:1271 length:534 start_codon:yes stop_codon:yes gene_type:complete